MIGILPYALILGALVVGTLRNSSVALTAVFFMFSLEQLGQSSSRFLLQHNTFTNIAIGIIVLIAIAKKIFSREKIFYKYPKVVILVLLLYTYAYISLLWSPGSVKGYEMWSHFVPYLIISLLLTPLIISTEKDVNVSSNYLLVLSVPLIILLLFFSEWENRRLIIDRGIEVVYGNPLEIGTFSAIVFVVAVFHNYKKMAKLGLIFRVFILAISASLLVVSGSRGQFLSIIITIYMLWAFRYKVKSPMQFIFSGVILLFISYLLLIVVSHFGEENVRWSQDKIISDISGRYDNSIYLLVAWSKSVLPMIVGLGNSASYNIMGIYPHNVPVEIISEEGLIGFLFYIMIVLSCVSAFRKIIIHTENGTDKRKVGIIIMGWLLINFILSLKQGSLLSSLYFFMFSIILCKYSNYIVSTKNNEK